MKNLLPLILGLAACTSAQRRPPNYGQDQMPETSFSCSDKIIGGYYADPETDCQMFHVCVKIPGKGVQDFRFLCPNDTSFDQENQICDDWYNIDCEAATLYYSDNFDLYRLGGGFGKVGGKVVNNAVGDVTDDNYLQRADRGDNVPQDIFRGSQSGNFFSNRNGGREDYDDVDTGKPKKKSAHDKQSKQLFKGSQEPAKEVTYHQNKDSIRYQNRNSNFRRNQGATSTVAVEASTTTTQKPSRGQPNRQDFYRQRSQASTTLRPTGQENSYNPTTVSSKPAFSYQPTTLRPFSNFGNQQPTTLRQNYQNVAVTTARPNHSNFQKQQTTAKTYQEISRTYPTNPAANTPLNNPHQPSPKPYNNQLVSTQNPHNFHQSAPNHQPPAPQNFNFNQKQVQPTSKPFNNFNQQPASSSPAPFNNFKANHQQSASPTPKPFNNFNANQQSSFPTPTPKPFNNFNGNQQSQSLAPKPYNNFNQQPASQTAKPFNNFNANQQTTQTQRPLNNFNTNQQTTQTQKPFNNFGNGQQQPNAKPYNGHVHNQYTTPPQQTFASNQNFNGNYNQNNYNTQRPQTNYNTPSPQRNQQTQASFSTQKSFSQSFSESTEVARINNFNRDLSFGSSANPFQNFDVPKVTTSRTSDFRAFNHQYPEEQDEFLKASHSQNLGSSLRAKAFNVSQAAAFNYIPSGTTGKPRKPESKTTPDKGHANFNAQTFTPKSNGFAKDNLSPPRTQPSTFPPQPPQKKYNPTPDRTSKQFQQATPNIVQQTTGVQQTSPQPFAQAKPQASQDNQDYDYAYYDSANPSEYEGIGNVEFRKTTPHKNAT